METITCVLDGDVEHADSLGNKGMISAGDVQWMTAAAASCIIISVKINAHSPQKE